MTQTNTHQSNILVVDDTPENLTVLRQMLMQHGYQVRPVLNGELALKTVQKILPDLILLDIRMSPGIDGYEVCRRLKADERTRDIPVLFISALDEAVDKVKAFKVGGLDYIIKPFQPEEVLARVETHLALQNMQKRLQKQNIQLSQKITEHKQAEEALQQRNCELSLLNRVSQMFSSSLELDEVLKTALGEIQRLLEVVSTSIWLIVPETDELICMQATGPGSENIAQWRLAPGQGITGWVAQHGESVVVPDTWADERHLKKVDEQTKFTVRSMLGIPLRVQGEVIGVLNLVDSRVGSFTSDDVTLLEPIAAAAAIAIDNARLFTTAQQEIAERWQAEAKLRAAHKELKEKNVQLQEANASKDKFFSIISHDLRSPFNTLLGYTQLLIEHFETYSQEKLKQYIERVHTSAERLYVLLENLLTWSRIQRGVIEYEPKVLDLQDIANDNIDLFTSKAEQKQVTLNSAVQEEILVYADYNMANTVVRNLVANALKFTKAGDTIEISAQAHETSIEITVSDTGTGICQEDISKLFRIDVQYTNVGTAGEKGTGLGLILCQDLVKKNGGKIWVESEVGKGTTFRFTLPRQPVE
jgi:signal transduction histidine kinase/DNA-binding response OmpR family regulator